MKVDWRQRPEVSEQPASTTEHMKLLDPALSLIEQFEKNLVALEGLIGNLAEEFCERPYGPGKWSIKDTIQHLCDDERIYVYRAMRFARGDTTTLPGFDQDLFAAHAFANSGTRGSADGNEFSVRALGFHIAGMKRTTSRFSGSSSKVPLRSEFVLGALVR